MKKMLFLLFVCFFTFSSTVQAKTCSYSSVKNQDIRGSYQLAQFDVTNNNGQFTVGTATVSNLQVPKMVSNGSYWANAGGWAAAGAGGAATACAVIPVINIGAGVCALVGGIGGFLGGSIKYGIQNAGQNKITTTSTEDLGTVSKQLKNYNCSKNKCNVKYYNSSNKNATDDLSSYDMLANASSEFTCPPYFLVYYNDIVDSDNVQFYAGDEGLKNKLQDLANANSNYNFLIWGSEYESQADDCEGDECNENLPELDTCEGMLGERDANGNYTENSVGWLLQVIFDYLKIAALVCVFVFSVVDYAKALIGQEQDLFKKANTNTLKRIIFGIVFFILPIIVDLILKVIDTSTCGIK